MRGKENNDGNNYNNYNNNNNDIIVRVIKVSRRGDGEAVMDDEQNAVPTVRLIR